MSKLEELPAKEAPAPSSGSGPAAAASDAKKDLSVLRPICPHCGADPLELALRQEAREIGMDQIRTHIYFCQSCKRPVAGAYTVQIVPPQLNSAVHPLDPKSGIFRMPGGRRH